MTSITKLAWATTVCLLSSYGASGSTVTSTTCSATVGTQTFIQTNPSSCSIYQNATNGTTLYNITATADAYEGLYNEGLFEGNFIIAGYESLQTNTDYFGSAQALEADASATTTATFSSAVPSAAGTITFAGGCVVRNNGAEGFEDCAGAITLIDSLGTTNFTAPSCPPTLQLGCASVTLPIELGSDFTVELSEDNEGNFGFGGPTSDDPSVLFTLAQLNGTPVSVELAPVPEPSTVLSVGLFAIAAGLFRWRRNKVT